MILERVTAAAALCVAACAAPQAPAQGRDSVPRRIVSLDYCADQYVLKFADRDQIAALSPDAVSGFSYLREEARGLPRVRPNAEDVLALRPDLVVRSYGGGPRIEEFLARANIPAAQLLFADDVAGAHENMRAIARTVGRPERADAAIAAMNAQLARAKHAARGRSVLYLTPGGVTAGAGSFIDSMITQAGFVNYVREPGWRALPLEDLTSRAPDLILFATFPSSQATDLWSSARHDIIAQRLNGAPRVMIDGAATACGAWFVADIAEALSAAP